MSATLALDIGGTKIAYGIIRDDTPTTIDAEGRIPSQPAGKTVAEQVDAAVAAALDSTDVLPTRVGIGAPGVVLAPQGEIVYNGATIPGWSGTNLTDIVHKHLDAPVACHNDVRIWAWGEHHLGAGREFAGRVIYVSVGTGIGGAVIEDGQLIDGPTGSAGEFSDLVAADFRGLADRVENIASGPSLARYVEVLAKHPDAGRIPWTNPAEARIDLREVLRRYDRGDELARSVVEGNLFGLGAMLGPLVSAFDISAVVLGGGVCGIGSVITDPIKKGIRTRALQPNQNIPIVTSRLQGNAPLIAAAAYARANTTAPR
ncbi:MAG: ROK family protein [Corynebacterium sp.]|nr:ROK family protein [Corynebacterium sp.]